METVKSIDDFDKLEHNRISGNPEMINSSIFFKGVNNVLYCEGNVKLTGATISFEGNNSIVYLSAAQYGRYPIKVVIYNDSTLFIGKDNNISAPVNINIQENQNVIIGSDGIIGSGVMIRTSDAHLIYDASSKTRINFAHSVFIGDHVWLGHLSYISRGVKIGSGAIVSNDAFVPDNALIYSNTMVVGNPARIYKKDVFFVGDFTGHYKAEDSLNSKYYKSDVFIYDVVNQETLDLNRIDQILKDLDVDSRLEFIQKLFVRNKRKNRFVIK